jgi:hypothetical protein
MLLTFKLHLDALPPPEFSLARLSAVLWALAENESGPTSLFALAWVDWILWEASLVIKLGWFEDLDEFCDISNKRKLVLSKIQKKL